MREAVLVSTARTPIGKAFRGAFNDTQAQELAGHAIYHAVNRARVETKDIDDKGMFEADDEVGTIFEQINSMIVTLNDFLAK